MVRLICVFLQQIIKARQINIQDLHVDIQTFCITFPEVKNANDLLKDLQIDYFKQQK